LSIKKHINFLLDVFVYTISAFGGPQGHIGMLHKKFVVQKKYLTEEELFEYFSFCQLLPGASSTQTIALIGYKKGGLFLSFITILIWILPACILMTYFSLLLSDNLNHTINKTIFQFIQPMAIGFLLYTIYNMYLSSIINIITKLIMLLSAVITIFLFKSPWIFPLLILSAGLITNISNKRIPDREVTKPNKAKWYNLIIFLFIFLIAGFLSETARKQNWENRKSYNLFENFYRFGSIVFGGGDLLLPMMLDQYVERPLSKVNANNTIVIDKDELINGYGIVRVIPGPVFSIAAYVGSLTFKKEGQSKQIIGAITGAIALFLPSIFILFFLFPIYQNIKNYVIVFRALEGIKSVIVGLLIATSFYLLKDSFPINLKISTINIAVIFGTFIIQKQTKIHSPFIVLFCLLLGWVF
jgi:chromate transporter